MSIAEKLIAVAENEQRVYEAGYNKGKSEGSGGISLTDNLVVPPGESLIGNNYTINADGTVVVNAYTDWNSIMMYWADIYENGEYATFSFLPMENGKTYKLTVFSPPEVEGGVIAVNYACFNDDINEEFNVCEIELKNGGGSATFTVPEEPYYLQFILLPCLAGTYLGYAFDLREVLDAESLYEDGFEEGEKAGAINNAYKVTKNGKSLCFDNVLSIEHEVSVQLSNKNLFDIDKTVNAAVTEFNGIKCLRYTDGATFFKFATDFKENTQYTLTIKTYRPENDASLNISIHITYTDGTKTSRTFAPDTLVTIASESGKTIKQIAGGNNYAKTCYIDLTVTQLEEGTEATEFTPFITDFSTVTLLRYGANETENLLTYIPNSDGLVDNVKSLSPLMQLTTDTKGVIIKAECLLDNNGAYSEGKKAEYDAFWDAYQDNGNRTDYKYAFSQNGWNNETFKPKYPIIAKDDASYMFYDCGLTDFDFVEKGIIFDTSEAASLTYIFRNCRGIKRIGTIDCSKCKELNRLFYSCSMETIDNLIVHKDLTYSNTFDYATIENITISGEIGKNGFKLTCSTLSKASIESIINALSSTATGLTVTLSKVAVNNAFGIDVDDETTWTEEWNALRNSKSNWTFSFA